MVDNDEFKQTDKWRDRSVFLPYDPPGMRGKFEYPGRCWELRWRDRLGWWFFCLFASHDHTTVVWQTFRSTRRASSTTWQYENGSGSQHQVPQMEPLAREAETILLTDD